MNPCSSTNELPDGLPLHPALVQGQDSLAPRLDERLLVGGPLAQGWLQECRHRRRVGQRAALEHPVAGGPDAVAGHRVTADVQVAGDAPVRLAAKTVAAPTSAIKLAFIVLASSKMKVGAVIV